MDRIVIVQYPHPIELEARPVQHDAVPEGSVGLGYYYQGKMVARGVMAPEVVPFIHQLLAEPVHLALLATEDDDGNIDARVCLVVPVDSEIFRPDEPSEEEEPWRASVPPPPPEVDSSSWSPRDPGSQQMALLPLGNVVRAAQNRNHPDDLAADAREMLDNLMAGRAQDAVERAIEDLLRSI